MFHSRTSNNKVNLLDERALRMIYDEQTLSYEELFQKDNLFAVYHFNTQTLALKCSKSEII